MSKEEELRKERVLYVLNKKGIKTAKDIAAAGSAIYMNVYKQLFSNEGRAVSTDVIAFILGKYPDVSADYLMRGEGGWERKTHIVTTTKQEIHVDGGQAAITQSGEAKVEAPKDTTPKEQDIATMIRNNDLGGLVAIIMQQKDEIIRLKEQRIRDLEQSVRIADTQLFPPVK